ncbi:MAG TPA: thiamine phosphate synthase [Blastocatellia bacterium]|nr:thiamine phosphate synthase [Blastocatellia bacterium]
MPKLPGFYAITDCQLSNCTHEEIVEMMLAGGAGLIQLRDKEAGAREILDAARACLKLTRAAGAKLIINDRVDVAMTAEADGVHLGQTDLSVEEAREILGEEKIIGVSTHSIEQLHAAFETSADYVAVGPIYPTKTKENPDPVVGLDLIREARRLSDDRPIVAIGGITLERVPEVMAAGADAVAVISALYPFTEIRDFFTKPDITGRVRAFLELLGE